MVDPFNNDPLDTGSSLDDPFERDPLPPERWERNWQPIGVTDFVARRIEDSNPLATDDDKELAAKAASNIESLRYIDEIKLDRLQEMDLGHTTNKAVSYEKFRRRAEQEPILEDPAPTFFEEADLESDSESDTDLSDLLIIKADRLAKALPDTWSDTVPIFLLVTEIEEYDGVSDLDETINALANDDLMACPCCGSLIDYALGFCHGDESKEGESDQCPFDKWADMAYNHVSK